MLHSRGSGWRVHKKSGPRGAAFVVMNCPDQALGAHTEHQPPALTSFPGKIWQGRHSSPSLPWINAQFAQVWPSVVEECTYFSDCAVGSSSVRRSPSCALASLPGATRQPAAATAEIWMNWRLAILLKVVSSYLVSGPTKLRASGMVIQKFAFTRIANVSHFQLRPTIAIITDPS